VRYCLFVCFGRTLTAVLHRLLGRHEQPVADTLVVRLPW
jgi:hypothetical protein